MEVLIDSREKKKVNIDELSQYQELSNVKTRSKEPKQFKKQRKRLARKDMKNLGLYSLPRESMKYKDYEELYKLWSGYMEEQFKNDFQQLEKSLSLADPHYDMMSGMVHKSDFHGAKLKVIQSKCPSLTGLKGIVVKETKETFNILGKDDILRVVPKAPSLFELKWKKVRFTVLGKHIKMKSAERSVKKLKCIRLAQL
jgi:ribonuclease P protein subunit POP4